MFDDGDAGVAATTNNKQEGRSVAPWA